jgi:hypothetical protein
MHDNQMRVSCAPARHCRADRRQMRLAGISHSGDGTQRMQKVASKTFIAHNADMNGFPHAPVYRCGQ